MWGRGGASVLERVLKLEEEMDSPGGCFFFPDREEYSLMKGRGLEGEAGPARGRRKGPFHTRWPPGVLGEDPDISVSSGVAALESPSVGSPALWGLEQGPGHLHPWTESPRRPLRVATCPPGRGRWPGKPRLLLPLVGWGCQPWKLLHGGQ